MSRWRVLDFLRFKGRLEYCRGRLKVLPDEGNPSEISLADVTMILAGLNVSFGRTVFQQLSQFDVNVMFCDWRGVPVGAMHGWSDHTRVGARHRAQASLSVPRAKNAWGQIIRSKIRGQSATLRALDRPGADRLIEMASTVRSGDPDNVEALAARWYWSRVFSGEDFARFPGGGNGRNAQLDYGYSVLRGHAVRAVLSAGLAPTLGVFHRGRSNYFNLADDIIEPFRPAVDDAVGRLPPDADVEDSEVKRVLVAAAGRAYADDGRTVPAEMTALAQQFGRYVEGDVSRLTVRAWLGPKECTDAPGSG